MIETTRTTDVYRPASGVSSCATRTVSCTVGNVRASRLQDGDMWQARSRFCPLLPPGPYQLRGLCEKAPYSGRDLSFS